MIWIQVYFYITPERALHETNKVGSLTNPSGHLFLIWAISLQLATAQTHAGHPVAGTTTQDTTQQDGRVNEMLTIFVYPPSDPIDYNCPSSALWSIFRIEAKRFLLSRKLLFFSSSHGQPSKMKLPYRSTIGHTLTCISCTLPDGAIYQNWVSLSSHHYTDSAVHLLFRERTGLAFLMHNYSDGTLIRGDENLHRLIHYIGRRKGIHGRQHKRIEPRYMAFHLSAVQCAAIKEMVEFYTTVSLHSAISPSARQDSLGPDVLYFTNMIDPFDSYRSWKQLKKGVVGGGCAPFAVGLLKASGHFLPVYDQFWKRSFSISEHLIGSSRDPIPVMALLFGESGKSWTYPGKPEIAMNIYDPELIWEFIGILTSSFSEPVGEAESRDSSYPLTQWLNKNGLDVLPGKEIDLFSPPARPTETSKFPVVIPNHQGNWKRSINGVIISKRNADSLDQHGTGNRLDLK